MKKIATIWRESVYKNDFKCNVCGETLAHKNGIANDKVKVDMFNYVFCRNCNNVVARIEQIEAPENMHGLQGNYADFKEGNNE